MPELSTSKGQTTKTSHFGPRASCKFETHVADIILRGRLFPRLCSIQRTRHGIILGRQVKTAS